ncbi:HDOD domain-containing protein [Colwellia sp. 12G3]|uniref:HDOD domain-containing protein n=1 Tax=Colwellia sp. 12G3 TaxID=2058299 RepID=UPI000C34D119|nr:HDOD domain-containing protein [Colwellia sp. 12G3]PKI17806.1 HDOD domain-containing protein [Colwellia sp. 12G3]
MFKTMLKHLFPSIKSKKQPNYLYFEKDKVPVEEMQQQAFEEPKNASPVKPLRLASIEETHRQDFYDFLFGQSPATTQHDELSHYVADKIEAVLRKPNTIIEAMPVLPASLSQVIDQLTDENFDTQALLDLIQQEPSIAAKVIELSNSSFYNRTGKEIADLKSAFMLLGSNGLIEGVINGFVSKLTPQSQIYFKQYGNKIWHHSLTTGVISKELINRSLYKKEAAQGYLIGLICNLGDMIIYQLLMEAFSFIHPDCQPNSYAFKELMQQKSKKLTYHIAKHWQFPQSILDALALQVKVTNASMLSAAFSKHPIACFAYEGNIISELIMMLEHNDKTEGEIKEAAEVLLCSGEAKQYVERVLAARVNS